MAEIKDKRPHPGIKRDFASPEERNKYLQDPLIQAIDNKAYNIQMLSVPTAATHNKKGV